MTTKKLPPVINKIYPYRNNFIAQLFHKTIKNGPVAFCTPPRQFPATCLKMLVMRFADLHWLLIHLWLCFTIMGAIYMTRIIIIIIIIIILKPAIILYPRMSFIYIEYSIIDSMCYILS